MASSWHADRAIQRLATRLRLPRQMYGLRAASDPVAPCSVAKRCVGGASESDRQRDPLVVQPPYSKTYFAHCPLAFHTALVTAASRALLSAV